MAARPAIERYNVMPDLLPRTFHLAESSALFSQINSATPFEIAESQPIAASQEYSVVAIRESNLSAPSRPTFPSPQSERLTPKVGEINTVSILEKVDYFEPEYVETVHIIDATSETSDTDTCATPVFDESRRVSDISGQQPAKFSPKILKVERKKIKVPLADRERAKTIAHGARTPNDDRDLLHDSEIDARKAGKLKKKPIVPGLKDNLSGTGRDSFYNSDHENFEEPLVFSDDDDDEEASEMMSTDYDSDDDDNNADSDETVFIF